MKIGPWRIDIRRPGDDFPWGWFAIGLLTGEAIFQFWLSPKWKNAWLEALLASALLGLLVANFVRMRRHAREKNSD
jgi:hypothetical protein